MKVYIVSGIGDDGIGVLLGFTNKVEAEKFDKDLAKNGHQSFGIDVIYFPLSKKGIIEALNYGAEQVRK